MTNTQHPNVTAFLDMIAHAEGTDRIGTEKGYNVLVGGSTFLNYDNHPNVRVVVREGLVSTAAGRYQILYKYWVHYRKKLRLPDFSPESQDQYAVNILREQRAYDDVIAGRVAEAVHKCRNIWASLPGAGYGQREVPLETLVAFYKEKGGSGVA